MSALPEPAPTPDIADGAERELHPSYVRLRRLSWWISWGFATAASVVAVGVVLLVLRPAGWIIALAAAGVAAQSALLAWFAVKWPALEHRHARYRVDETGVEIRGGVLWRHRVHVARSRVQHTDVAQGPLERRLGLARLKIFTAGTDHAEVELVGVDHGTAVRVRDHLLPEGAGDAV